MQQAWQGNTYGNSWMHRQLIGSLRFMDVRLLYLFAALFIVPVAMLVNHSNTAHIYRYLHCRHGFVPLKAAWKTYVNHCLFSQVVIDRFAMYAGKHFKTTIVGYDHYLALAQKGYVQLSAHIGNYEMAGYTLKAKDKRFNALVYGGEKATVMANRDRLFSDTNIRMIPIAEDGSHLFVLNEALANNEIVSMPADRFVGSAKSITVNLLGREAKLPMGPFSVATMRGMDVLAVNVMKTSLRGYTIYVSPLAYDNAAGRREQQQQLADSYTACLEEMLKRYPTQWYNYYDFWK